MGNSKLGPLSSHNCCCRDLLKWTTKVRIVIRERRRRLKEERGEGKWDLPSTDVPPFDTLKTTPEDQDKAASKKRICIPVGKLRKKRGCGASKDEGGKLRI